MEKTIDRIFDYFCRSAIFFLLFRVSLDAYGWWGLSIGFIGVVLISLREVTEYEDHFR